MWSILQAVTDAEAASTREDWGKASRLWTQIVQENGVNPDYWAKLAAARFGAGQYEGAIAAAQEAIALGAAYPVETGGFPADHAAFIARCWARLGDAEQTLTWLETALGMGFRHLAETFADPDLSIVLDDPRFAELLGQVDLSGLSRVDGWRADLRFLGREIERRAYAPFGIVDRSELDMRLRQITEAVPAMSDAEILCELSCLMRLLDDGHAFIHPPEHRDDLRLALPVVFYLFAEGLFVIAAAPEHADLLGAQVVAFAGRPTADVIAAVEQIVTRDNERQVLADVPYRLRELPVLAALGIGHDPSRIELSIRDLDGRQRHVTLAGSVLPEARSRRFPMPPEGWSTFADTLPTRKPSYLRRADANYWFEHLPGLRAVYMQFNSVRNDPDDPFAGFTERMFTEIEGERAERLIIDVRWNGGGNTMLFRPLLHGIVGSRTINRQGGLYVIIGRRTFSAAQNFVSFLDYHTEAIFVGEPTGSRPTFIGETSTFTLPYSKAEVNVSDLRWTGTWPGDMRSWIAPHLYAPPTFAAYRENRDPAMEAILAELERGAS